MTRRGLLFGVGGRPAGKGSLRTFQSKHTGRHMADHPPETKRFQKRIERAAALAMESDGEDRWQDPIGGPVAVDLEFRFPVAVVRAVQARDNGRIWHEVLHDVDKLERTVLDALQRAGVIVNDSRVVRLTAVKYEYPREALRGEWEQGGVIIRVEELPHLPDLPPELVP